MDLLDLVDERVVVYDGATGTYLQGVDLGPEDFGGNDLDGCNEILSLTRPDVIEGFHDAYLSVGADVVETNTFGAFAVPLAEYDLVDKTHEINVASARIAKEVAAGYSTPDSPRFVAGSIGPGTKMPSLGHIGFAELRDAYEVQARALIEGGVDLFLIETQYDLLGLKAAVNGCRRAMASAGRTVPLQTQVTMELTGRMLPGTEIGAALAAVDPLRPDIIGLNCATGPGEMSEHLRHLSNHSRRPISCLPNAGMPSVVEGEMVYDLTPEQLVEHQSRFITDLGVRVVGGCCGTGPEHIRALAEVVKDLTPAERSPAHEPGATSIYSHVPFDQDTSFLIIGERTNANGSKKFREAMLEGDFDTCLKMATDQVGEGAHVLDLCVDYVGRDGTVDMHELAGRFGTQVAAPLVLDSTEPEVMEAGLFHAGGRCILNSANLEDGEADGSRLDRVLTLCRDHGAAAICLLIDEEGQARDLEWKMRVAHRIHDIATQRYGLEPSDLIFDALTFPLSTGDDDLRQDGIATIDAIRRIKAELPGVYTTLGVSNVSFGLKPAARHVLNSVFLAECVDAGLDSAIVHAARIMPLSKIPDDQRQVALDLVWDRRGTDGGDGDDPDYDPLQHLLAVFEDVDETATEVVEDRSDWTVEQLLEHRIIDGDRDGLEDDLDRALAAGTPALSIVNDTLLAGMKVVGELFGAGEMQLPFVLQSAETMKAAVAHLEPHMEKSNDGGKGKLVIATVKGDVHDIGKNLVDIILTNNGYDVHNLGIKCAVGEMIDKAKEVEADAIGMSGLLVKSTLIMRDNLEEIMAADLDIPVVLGGAALTRSYVERDLREVYDDRLFYGKDAFDGLRVMDRLGEARRSGEDLGDWGMEPGDSVVPARVKEQFGGDGRDGGASEPAPERSPEVALDNPVPNPPFLGSKVVKGISLDEIAEFVNETALFRNQWQYRPEKGGDGAVESDDEFKDRIRPTLRDQLAKAKADDLLVPQVVYGHFPANSDGDDLVVWTDESRATERARFPFPRQAKDPWLCIADFFRPVASGEPDYASFHIVTMGHAVSEQTAELFEADRYEDYLLLHGIGVEMAEALAELWHGRIRAELGIDGEDDTSLQGLFRQKYRGGRYSWGYPACPDLEQNVTVADLLEAHRLGLEVSDETGFQFQPEQTTSAIICHHPRAKYFVA